MEKNNSNSQSKAKKWSKEVVESHWCEKCNGKIICVSIDKFGNPYCGYCGQRVYYPQPTKGLLDEIESELKRRKSKGV